MNGKHPAHEQIQVDKLGSPRGHYSHAVRVGDLLFVSGCLPVNDQNELVGGNDFVAQARKAFHNLGVVLEEAGFGFEHLARLTIYLTDMRNAFNLTPLRSEILGEVRPATTVIGISELATPEIQLEVDAIASLPAAEPRSA